MFLKVNLWLVFLKAVLNFRRVLLKPTKIIDRIPVTGGSFYICTIIDKTTIMHFLGGFVFSFVGYRSAFMLGLGMEVSDGTGTDESVEEGYTQGFDLMDFFANFLGMTVHGLLELSQI